MCSVEIPSKDPCFPDCVLPAKLLFKDPPTHGGVYLDHLEQFGVSVKTFEKIPRNVSVFSRLWHFR